MRLIEIVELSGQVCTHNCARRNTVLTYPKGDMGIAVPTQFVSTNDLIPTRNALSTMFAAIDPTTGALPESGPPLSQLGSDTYHMWTLIGTHNYFLFSGDTDWLQGVWANYTKAVGYVLGKVDSSGLMNVTGLRDWARLGGGGHNSEGNALLYQVGCYTVNFNVIQLTARSDSDNCDRSRVGSEPDYCGVKLVIQCCCAEEHIQRGILAAFGGHVP